MNNDVAGKLNNDFDAQKNASNAIEKRAAQKSTNPINSSEFISKNVDKSVQNFLNDSVLVQAHVDFCDFLVEHGYCLEEAMKKTDDVFEVLRQKETY
ncbi:MAG: hypothetical protein IKU37_06935 [Candidatus Gastranaerophilales bacterium]|nr:hypothetical protein [Candidatus Gastranaerophilales bacterium]